MKKYVLNGLQIISSQLYQPVKLPGVLTGKGGPEKGSQIASGLEQW